MPATTQLDQLHTQVRANGMHVALHAEKGRLTELVIEEGDKRVRAVRLGPPRPMTVEQAARELLVT